MPKLPAWHLCKPPVTRPSPGTSSDTQVVMLSGACALVRTSASQFLVLEDLEGNLLCFWGLAVVFGLFVVFLFLLFCAC